MEDGTSKLTTRRPSLINGLTLKLLMSRPEMSSLRTGLLTKKKSLEPKLNSLLPLKPNGQRNGKPTKLPAKKPIKILTDQSEINSELLSKRNHKL
jgi:hypothetical protein